MNVCVYGLWHLGTVTAACLASGGHQVTAVDADRDVVERLRQGEPPIFEPGLQDMVRRGLDSGGLRVVHDAAVAVAAADVVWVALDTPVADDDRGDVEAVVGATSALLPYVKDGALVLLSSQVTVGTTSRLEQSCARLATGRSVSFAYAPENLRLGSAIASFTGPERVVVGVRSTSARARIAELLRPFTERIEWMSVESAEMTKHALNAFLATSVTFINEIASICEQVGADAAEVQRGLTSDGRIGPRAYLSPGAAFAGGTLARDISFLSELGKRHDVATPLISSVPVSNHAHGRWEQNRLVQLLGDVRGTTIAVWGLTYKPGTNTLRRSRALELCRWLAEQGADVRAHDPMIQVLPGEMAGVRIFADPLTAVQGAAALVVATGWPAFREVSAVALAGAMTGDLVLDASGFLARTLGAESHFRYVRVGRAAA